MAKRKSKRNSGKAGSEDKVYRLLLTVDTRMTNIEERLSDVATKDNLNYMRDQLEERINEVKLEVRALGRAVDKDALSVMNFEKRIDRLEKKAAAS